MAGKFTNTTYYDTHDAILNTSDNLLSNPFYCFNDKKAVRVTYYNINKEYSTLDPGSKMAYAHAGEQTPLRWNKINHMYIYQFGRIELNMENGEFGLEAAPIEGESYIIPNTIHPYDGDFFVVDHIKGDEKWLFQVNNVEIDTLENGNNVWKFGWSLDRTTDWEILNNVVGEFEYVHVVEGSNISAVVESTKYDNARELEQLSIALSGLFCDLFYNSNVQTLIYKYYTEYSMYDPFAIEFIKRNKILMNSDEYVYIDHAIPVPSTFSLDYNRSVFYAFETRDPDRLYHCLHGSQADYIDQPTSIFATRYEYYFALNGRIYNEENSPMNPRSIICIMDDDLVRHIAENVKYEEEENRYKNIFVRYFHKEPLAEQEINQIKNFDLVINNIDLSEQVFYQMLWLIFCLDRYTVELLS